MLEVLIYIADAVLIAVLAVAARQVYKALKHVVPHSYDTKINGEVDLPSVTICIPARNESHALTACLEKVVASTYQRLEVIVLDDVSGDDTSTLIKLFASEGVRFVKGSDVTPGWLGKNHALQGLLQEASGSYLLFIDVDTLLSPNAVENMIRYALSHRASMVSIVPRREDGWRWSVIASPLRYFWEIVFQRRDAPGASSNAWMIRRDVLQKQFGGFGPFKNDIQPEARIAAALSNKREYHFIVGTKAFGIGYEKRWPSQLATSVRLLYPLLYKQAALALVAVLDLLVLLVPFIVFVAFLSGVSFSLPIILLNNLIAFGFIAMYGMYTHRVWRSGWWLGAILWPLLVLQEVILILASLIQYSRGAVTWKGRSIQPEAQS